MRASLMKLVLAIAAAGTAPVCAKPAAGLSDTLRVTAGDDLTRKKLSESDEDGGTKSISVDSPAELISFVTAPGGTSDIVNFPAVHAVLYSDTEYGMMPIRHDNGFVITILDEDFQLQLLFASDVGASTSDVLTYQLRRARKPPKIIATCNFDEVMFGEDDVCALPDVTVDIAEIDGSSDLVTVAPLVIGVLSDKSGLKPFDDIVQGESGTIFDIRALSVAEPNSLAMIGGAFGVFFVLRYRLAKARNLYSQSGEREVLS